MRIKLEAANEKLTRKFHKHVDNPAPHASKMRENFHRQFGKAASAPEGTFAVSTFSDDDDMSDEEKGTKKKGGNGLRLNAITVGMSGSRPAPRTPGSGGVEGGIYSGIRRPGVQSGTKKDKDSDSKSSPSKSPAGKLDLSAHVRSPSILNVSRAEDRAEDDQAARLRQGGGQRQFGFSSSPASPGRR